MINVDEPLHGLSPQVIFQGDSHISPELGAIAFWKDYVFWLDVRTPEEKEHNRLSYAYDISLDSLPQVRLNPPKHSYVIPFSGSTFRTGVAWFWLKAMGYQRVFALPSPMERMILELDVPALRQRGIPLGCCSRRELGEYIVPFNNKENMMMKINDVMQDLDFAYLGSGEHAVTGQDFLELIKDDNVLFLDVRTDEELGCSAYLWAKHIPVHQLPDRVAELPKDKLIVPFCSSVFRASIAWAWLKSKGFEQVKTLVIGTENIATLLKPGSLFAMGAGLYQSMAVPPCCAAR